MTKTRGGARAAGLCVVALFASWMSGPAAAAQYTFTVPVEIRDIDARYPYAVIGCFLRGAQNEQIGYGEVRIDIRPNSRPYAANVTVAVDPGPGKNPLNITAYSCVVAHCTSLQDSNCRRAGLPNEPALQVEPGAPFRSQVDGPIK